MIVLPPTDYTQSDSTHTVLSLCALSVLCLCSFCALSVLFLCSFCALSVLFLCSFCALSVLFLCSFCALSVLFLCSFCALSVLFLCSFCALSVLFLCSFCALSVLFLTQFLIQFGTLAELKWTPCVTLQLQTIRADYNTRNTKSITNNISTGNINYTNKCSTVCRHITLLSQGAQSLFDVQDM